MSIFSTKCLLFSYVFAILEERIWELVTVIPSSYLRGLPEESSSSMNRTSRATGSQVDEVHLIPRLREPVKSLLDNFSTILRAAKVRKIYNRVWDCLTVSFSSCGHCLSFFSSLSAYHITFASMQHA